ncbi:MAG: energy transducer TonB [Burkholderiales bacterium]
MHQHEFATAAYAPDPSAIDRPRPPRAVRHDSGSIIVEGACGRYRAIGASTAIALHIAVFAWLLHFAPVREALVAAAPNMVNFITPPQLEVAPPEPPPQQRVEKPRPRPVEKPIQRSPLITTQREMPSAFVAPRPPPKPVEAEVAPKDETTPLPPAPVIPPRFNADYLQNPAPPYPPLARRMGEQGRVVLRVLVNTEGAAERVDLRHSSGSPRLDESALETVKRWKFVPARQGDQPVSAWVLVPISFSLQS